MVFRCGVAAGAITHTGPASQVQGYTPVLINCGGAGSAELNETAGTAANSGCIDGNFSCKTNDICDLP
jgi:hypothetical protein